MKIKSEARFTTFEAVSMIVGNSIGHGCICNISESGGNTGGKRP